MKNPEPAQQIRCSDALYPNEAWELISRSKPGNKPEIIDVSTPQEFRTRHLEGAINVSLFSRFFKRRLNAMDKNGIYMVYCKVGGRSKIARRIMAQQGFRSVHTIIGGTLLWEEAGLPFTSDAGGVNKISFCPVSIAIKTVRKAKKTITAQLYRMKTKAGTAL